jgi:hypothetical protein
VSRNFSDLLALVTGSRQAPTAATTSSISSLVREGAYNVNGQRSMFNNFLLDGMDNNAYGESNQGFDNQIIAIAPDSVAQFRRGDQQRERGIRPVLRRHGQRGVASGGPTASRHAVRIPAQHRPECRGILQAEYREQHGQGDALQGSRRSTATSTASISAARSMRDKLFFFLDYEGFRQTLTPLSVLTLPTQNELNGNLVVPVRNP